MGFKVRKSFKIAPGVRMTVTNKSLGLSAGVKGARVSANTSGRVSRTLSVPGTGISHTKSVSTRGPARRPAAAPQRAASPAPAPKPVAPPTPGMFAPKWEKELHRALVAKPDVNAPLGIAAAHEPARHIAALYETLRGSLPRDDLQRSLRLISWLYSTGYSPSKDEFLQKYLPEDLHRLEIAPGIDVEVTLSRTFVGLLLAELLRPQR